ncbi:MAG: 16S rRNA (cytosine(1402)-N(4))-methyltransferase RsmH, partial [Alphaproteobacteria bacterium]
MSSAITDKHIEKRDSHLPVMVSEVLEALDVSDGKTYVDGTFGAGGYTCAMLEAANCHVYAIDRDPSAIERAKEVKDKYEERFTFMRGCFGDVDQLLKQAGVEKRVNGFVLDIGVSSMQVDQAQRGFSFRFDGPLDMRMDTGDQEAQTAADIVNTYGEKELADLIYKYGQERHSRRIAKAIVKRRTQEPFSRTQELADCIRAVMPKKAGDKIDPATRSFQALRIA